MTLQRLLSYVRRAVDDYSMIGGDGGRIAVGVSGGKDSLALLTALAEMRRFYPKKYEVCAVTASLGFPGMDFGAVREYCERLGVDYSVVETDIGPIVFDERKEDNPCSLCSKMRKGALHDEAVRLGCNKVALGHSRDDAVETLFMSLFYEGRIHTFAPVTYLDRKGLYSIRPLVYAPEREISAFAKKYGLPVVANPCPANGGTKRQEIKEFVAGMTAKFPRFSETTFGAVARGIKGWEQPK